MRLRVVIAAVLAALGGALLAGVAVAERVPTERQATNTTTQTGIPTTGTTTTRDRILDLVVSGRKKQRIGPAITVRVRCGEVCQVTGKGKLSVRSRKRAGKSDRIVARKRTYVLKPTTSSLGRGQTVKMKLKLPKRARRAGLKTLRNRGKVKAQVVVDGADLAGNTATKQLGVSLKAKRKRR